MNTSLVAIAKEGNSENVECLKDNNILTRAKFKWFFHRQAPARGCY